jgi:energy-coupling factor transport system permease protein
MTMVPAYRPRSSPLHGARAGVAALFCLVPALVGALYLNPIVLAGALAATVVAALGAGVGREVAVTLRWSLVFALLIVIVNPLVYAGGDTLLVRGDAILGHRFDITLEAVVQGALAGFRIVAIVAAFGLFTAAVDPDELLRLFRRVSYRSALTASLTTRLVPVLARDAARRGDAARCRPEPPGRLASVRLALAGSLDRAVDVAAALEVRGYALAGKPARDRRARWSRHDLRVAGATALMAALAVAGRVAGVGEVEIYPRIDIAVGPAELALAVALPLIALLPFVGRSARLGVRRG